MRCFKAEITDRIRGFGFSGLFSCSVLVLPCCFEQGGIGGVERGSLSRKSTSFRQFQGSPFSRQVRGD